MHTTPTTLTRRSLLRRALGASCLTLGGGGIQRLAFAEDSAAASGRDLLVTIFLRGGCDGLGVLAPVDDPHYRAARQAHLRIVENGERPGLSIKNGYAGHDWRLHPDAAPLRELYTHGDLALIHACGLKNGTRSHFDAQDMMERGINEQKNLGLSTGWLTRLLDSLPGTGLLPGLSADDAMPASLLGSARAAAIANLQDFSYYGDDRQMKALRLMHSQSGELGAGGQRMLSLLQEVTKKLPKKPDGGIAEYTPAKGVTYPEHDFSNSLKTVAQLAKMEIGLQVAALNYGDWDTHTGQDYRLNDLVTNLVGPLRAFYEDISAQRQRATIVVMSEFGRRLKANESGGTDHGHGNLMFVLGAGIKGGRCHGIWPGLANDKLDEHADLAITTDYRQVLSEVLQNRMRGAEVPKVFPGFTPGPPLGLV
ncbi:DUF1501 domain-containing protein [Prosthecobacter sp.]|uniref:DUF1501 domain-containing protein n=1 Tax=Prosthecobacter sp. TaxID=1965333 RepID=UPI00378323CE